MLNFAGHITYISPSVVLALGYGAHTLIGADIFRVVHNDDADIFREAWNLVIAGKLARHRIECRCKHFEYRWFEVDCLLSATKLAACKLWCSPREKSPNASTRTCSCIQWIFATH